MSRKLLLTYLALGLAIAAGVKWPAAPAAEDRPSAKNPLPVRPNPPVKPLPPSKPNEPAKPPEVAKQPSAEKIPAVKPLRLTPPMSDEAIQAGLAKKVELDLAAVPLSQAIAAIKTQTNLDISTSPPAPNCKRRKTKRSRPSRWSRFTSRESRPPARWT